MITCGSGASFKLSDKSDIAASSLLESAWLYLILTFVALFNISLVIKSLFKVVFTFLSCTYKALQIRSTSGLLSGCSVCACAS